MASDHHIHQRTFAGLSPQAHPTAVPPNMAAVAVDCQLLSGTLTPWRTDARVPGITVDPRAGTLWVDDCFVMQEPCDASVVRVPIGCDAVYATGIYNAARTDGIPYPVQSALEDAALGLWTRLGLPCPDGALDVAWLEERRTEQRVTARAFLYTWENVLGQESTGSLPSAVTVQDFDDRCVLSGWAWPSPEYRVSKVHLYELRAGVSNTNAKGAAGEGAFFRVATVLPGTTTYMLDPSKVELGQMYDQDLFQEPPADLHDLQGWGTTQLAGVSGKFLYFSEPNFVHAWPDRYRVECWSTPIRFIAGRRFGYLLGCEAPQVVDLTNSEQSASGIRGLTLLKEKLPLVAERGAVPFEDGVVYASSMGLVHLHEATATVISTDLWSRQQWEAMNPPTMRMALFEGHLFLTSSTGTWRLKLQSGTWGKVDAFDITMLSIAPTAWYVTRAGVLVFSDATGIWQWNRGDSLKPYTYTSRTFTTPGRRGWSVGKIVSDTNDVMLTLRTGAVVLHDGKVAHSEAFRFRKGTTSTQHSYTLHGTAEVTEVHIASGFDALATA